MNASSQGAALWQRIKQTGLVLLLISALVLLGLVGAGISHPHQGADTFTQILKEESASQDERLVRPFEYTTSPSIKSAIPEVHHTCG